MINDGHTINEIIKNIMSDDFLNKDYIFTRMNYGLEILGRKEEETDIKVKQFIIDNYKNKLLFFTVNHPTNILLNEVLRQLLLKLGLKQVDILNDPEYISNDKALIYPSVLRHLETTFEYIIHYDEYHEYFETYIKVLYPNFYKSC